MSFCRQQQVHYKRMVNWHAQRSYRILNAGFYLQIKRGVVAS